MKPTFTFNSFPAEINLNIMHYAAPEIGTMREVEKTLNVVAKEWFKDACKDIAKKYIKLDPIVGSATKETDPKELFQILLNSLHTDSQQLNCNKLPSKNLKSYEIMNFACDYDKIIEEIKKAEIEKEEALINEGQEMFVEGHHKMFALVKGLLGSIQ